MLRRDDEGKPNGGSNHESLGSHCLDLLSKAGWNETRGNRDTVGNDTIKSLALAHCQPGAGTMTLLIEMAKAVASALPGTKVLLIDATHRGRVMHRRFRLSPRPSLTDALRHPDKLQTAIRQTGISGVSVAAIGKLSRSTKTQETLIGDLIDEVAADFDLVLIDLPIVNNQAAQANWYANIDRVALVIRPGTVRAAVAKTACENLRATGTTLSGVVMNQHFGKVGSRS